MAEAGDAGRRGARRTTGAALLAVLAVAACNGGPGPGTDATTPPTGCPAGWARVEPGTFAMGSPPGEAGRRGTEGGADGGPVAVTLARALCVPPREVTQAQWRDLLGTAPFQHAGCDDCPADCVNWWEAAACCNALSAREGRPACHDLGGPDGAGCRGGAPGQGTDCNGAAGMACDAVPLPDPACTGYRLPSEAEWERAARAGTTSATYGEAGGGELPADRLACAAPNPVLDPVAWYCGNSGMASRPAGLLAANAWGLQDVLGNVAEWCLDAWSVSHAGAAADGSPRDGSAAAGRVVRGGSWLSDAADVRAAARRSDPPSYRLGDVGFRCVRPAD